MFDFLDVTFVISNDRVKMGQILFHLLEILFDKCVLLLERVYIFSSVSDSYRYLCGYQNWCPRELGATETYCATIGY